MGTQVYVNLGQVLDEEEEKRKVAEAIKVIFDMAGYEVVSVMFLEGVEQVEDPLK